jgi:hypothetical protein
MSLADNFRAVRWLRTTNLILQAVLFLSFFGGLNYLALHFAWRFDLNRLHKHSLSAETRSYLAQLDKPVMIVVTFSENPEEEKYRQAYEDVRQLLREYIYATETSENGRIRVSQLDVFQRPREAQQMGAEQNQIIVVAGDGSRARIVRYEDLYRFQEGERTAFLGEQAITSAILDVASGNRKKVYFLTGHGEFEYGDSSPDRGLSRLRDELLARNFEIEQMHLREKGRIPEDAALLIAVRPTTPFEPVEEEMLREYLNTRAGRVLLLLDPRANELGLSDMLFDWGVLADQAIVWDAGPTGQSDTGGLILKAFAQHPVTQNLLDQNLRVSFGLARPVRVNPSRATDESLTVRALVGAAETAWGERDFGQSPPRYDAGVDLPGKLLTLAAASERVGATQDLNFSVPRGRLVVIGCADFVVNNRIAVGGNMALAFSSINWLVDRDTQLNIAPRPIPSFQLALSQDELTRLRYSLLFGLPAAAGLLGLLVYWTRRR